MIPLMESLRTQDTVQACSENKNVLHTTGTRDHRLYEGEDKEFRNRRHENIVSKYPFKKGRTSDKDPSRFTYQVLSTKQNVSDMGRSQAGAIAGIWSQPATSERGPWKLAGKAGSALKSEFR